MTELYGHKQRSEAAAKFIRDHTVINGYPPSLRQIAEHVGYASIGHVHRMLARMEEDGIITKGPPNVARSIRVRDAITPDAPRDRRNELDG